MRDASEAIFSQLKNTVYEVRGGTLQIYPQKKIAERILKSARNLAVLQNLAAPVQVRIHELGDQPVGKAKSGAGIPASPAPNSAAAAKISAIMGGEVIQDGGDNPF